MNVFFAITMRLKKYINLWYCLQMVFRAYYLVAPLPNQNHFPQKVPRGSVHFINLNFVGIDSCRSCSWS